MSRAVVGIDGGGSLTRALLLSPEGREVARIEGASTLVDPIHPEGCVATLRHLVVELGAHVSGPIGAVWAGLAGAGRDPVRRMVQRSLHDALGGAVARVGVGTDAEAAFYDAFGDEPGILLVAGTGSNALARATPGGEIRQVGGWGQQLGDEGSGYWIAMKALRALVRAHDGRGPRTRLSELLIQAGVDRPESLISWVAGARKGEVASLTPEVVRFANGGDPVARSIIEEAVSALAGHVRSVLEEEPGRLPVALVGGLIDPGRPLRARMSEELSEMNLRVQDGAVLAERGAAQLALTLLEPDVAFEVDHA